MQLINLRHLLLAVFVPLFIALTLPAVSSAKSSQSAQKAAKKTQSKKAVKSTRVAKAGKSSKANGARASVRGQKVWVKTRSGKRVAVYRAAPPAPPKPTMGMLAGLHSMDDPLELKSGVAFVVDQQTNEVLVSKNAEAILPIASITKLMTAVVVLDGPQDLNELIEITDAEIDTEKGTRSRLTIGTQLPRKEMLHLALMSSENRAAHALGRTYPGGIGHFIELMNAKAKSLGMRDTFYSDPTGLSSRNKSSAQDLAKLVQAAYKYPVIRHYSTDQGLEVANSTGKQLVFKNTNRLVSNTDWQIGLQKTGFISEAGQCLVMQTVVSGRSVIMVFLDSMGKLSRIGDAARVRQWMEASSALGTPVQPVRMQRKQT